MTLLVLILSGLNHVFNIAQQLSFLQENHIQEKIVMLCCKNDLAYVFIAYPNNVCVTKGVD